MELQQLEQYVQNASRKIKSLFLVRNRYIVDSLYKHMGTKQT